MKRKIKKQIDECEKFVANCQTQYNDAAKQLRELAEILKETINAKNIER